MHCVSMQRHDSHHGQQRHPKRLCSFACENEDLMSVQLLWDGGPGSAILAHAAPICTSSIYMQ